MLITSPLHLTTKLTIPTHQNQLYIQVTQADGLISPISKRVGRLKS